MIKPSKIKYATEDFVWRVANGVEENLENKIEESDKKNEERYDKMMTQLPDIAGQFKKFDEERVVLSEHSKKYTDKIENLEKKVFGAVQI